MTAGRPVSMDKRKFVRAAKSVPCADCGIEYPPYVMEFDHLPDYTKEFSICEGRSRSRDELQRELAKCEVVCRNCHAERTHQRRQKSIRVRIARKQKPTVPSRVADELALLRRILAMENVS